MTHSSSPFGSPQGEAAFLAAYDATMRHWTVPYEVIDLPSRFGSTRVVACGPRYASG